MSDERADSSFEV